MRTPDTYIDDAVESARESAEDWVNQGVAYTRTFPTKSVLTALAAGYLFRVLPIGRLLSVLLSLSVRLAKPALLIYGISKLYQSQTQGRYR